MFSDYQSTTCNLLICTQVAKLLCVIFTMQKMRPQGTRAGPDCNAGFEAFVSLHNADDGYKKQGNTENPSSFKHRAHRIVQRTNYEHNVW